MRERAAALGTFAKRFDHMVAEASRRRLVSIMLLATGLTALALVATLSLVLS